MIQSGQDNPTGVALVGFGTKHVAAELLAEMKESRFVEFYGYDHAAAFIARF